MVATGGLHQQVQTTGGGSGAKMEWQEATIHLFSLFDINSTDRGNIHEKKRQKLNMKADGTRHGATDSMFIY